MITLKQYQTVSNCI